MFENCAVRHVKYGEGVVLSLDEAHIRIRFSDENQTEKTFLYPEAFENFLSSPDDALQKEAAAANAQKKAAFEQEQKARAEQFRRDALARKKERAEKLKKAKRLPAAKAPKAAAASQEELPDAASE